MLFRSTFNFVSIYLISTSACCCKPGYTLHSRKNGSALLAVPAAARDCDPPERQWSSGLNFLGGNGTSGAMATSTTRLRNWATVFERHDEQEEHPTAMWTIPDRMEQLMEGMLVNHAETGDIAEIKTYISEVKTSIDNVLSRVATDEKSIYDTKGEDAGQGEVL